MSESQLDEIEASNELLDWKDNEETWRQGSSGPNANLEHAETSDAPYRYIPMSVLKKHFSKPRIQGLLDVLFLGSEQVAPDAETILKKYLRPFLILVLIAHGRQISRFVEHDNLKDDCLPFLALPHELKKNSTWFPSFCENQWQFYPVQFTYNMDRDLSSRNVLPLRYGRKLGGRGSAITYKIRIDPEYNRLQASTPGEMNTLERNRDTFVIKSYQTDEARECYETECDGFRKLRHDSKPPANIIAFYGNFKWGTSHNILLEYADRGTLQDYIVNVRPPDRREEIQEFWQNVIALLDGLAIIHGKVEMPSGKHKFMIGWHQELSPSNILVQSGKSERPHDCRFNIADLERRHVQKPMGLRDATAKDSQGTFAYSAPEIFKTDPDLQRWNLQGERRVDVWSIGCILSVVAVWVAFGHHDVHYHQCRGVEFKRETGKEGQCFHDGRNILGAVSAMHKQIKDRRRMTDEWTLQVINIIEKDMMVVSPTSRKTAKHLSYHFKQIMDKPLVADGGPPLAGHSAPKPDPVPPPSPSGFSQGQFASKRTVLDVTNHDPEGQSNPPLYSQSQALGLSETHTGELPGIKPNAGEYYLKDSVGTETNLDSDHHLRHFNIGPSVHSEPVPEREYKPLPLAEALNLRRQERQSLVSRIAGSLTSSQLIDSLKGRDHVFVLDSSASMKKYVPLMKKWLEVIGDMVHGVDSDGMKIYFAGSSMNPEVKAWEALVLRLHLQFFDAGRPGFSQVPRLIKRILEDYQNQLTKTHYVTGISGFKDMSQKGPRKMSMYVLTNGEWSTQRDLENQIRALVDGLCKNDKRHKQVAIQFLRFGNSSRGIEHLDKLERGLDLELDLIETEPAEGGDVYKVMLGAMDENFDMPSDLNDTGLAKASDTSQATPVPIDETSRSDFALANPSSQYVKKNLREVLSSYSHTNISDLVRVVFLLTVMQQPVSFHFLGAVMRYPDESTPDESTPDEATRDKVYDLVFRPEHFINLTHGLLSIKQPALREWLAHDEHFGESFGALPYNAIAAHDLLARMTLMRVLNQGHSITSSSESVGSEEVESYCAKYWMEHFRQANEFLSPYYLDRACDAFVEVDGPIRWIHAYEVSTARDVPYHRTLEPLFGGCYFGLRAVVDRALQRGMDVEAKDQFWKTPLHWASEFAHTEIVDVLLSYGASADTRDHAGWTALHFAAQNGHSAVINLLIRKTNVRISMKTFDGKTPLQLAIESNHIKVVCQLIIAGAAPSVDTYGGNTNYLQISNRYSYLEIGQLLVSPITVCGDLLQDFINKNSHAVLVLLLVARAEVVKASYPWIVELEEDKLPAHEIADLLLKSENLHWIKADQRSMVSSLEKGLPKSLAHQNKCIHTLNLDEISKETLTGHKFKGDAATEAETSDTSPSTSSSGSITSLSGRLLDPLEYFGRLETREQTTMSLCGIGGVFSPGYSGLNPGSALLSGKVAWVQYGDFGKTPVGLQKAMMSTKPRYPPPQPHFLRLETNPKAVEDDLESPHEPFERSPTDSDDGYISLTDLSDSVEWEKDTAQKIAHAFENLLRAIHWLRNDSGCCDCFTILISTSARAGVVSMRRIKFASLLNIFQKFEFLRLGPDEEHPSWTSPLASACVDLLQELGLGTPFRKYIKEDSRATTNAYRCLHIAAELAQICSVGLVTYTRGHSRDFQSDHLSRPIDVFRLLGTDPKGPSVSAQRVRLACLDNMLRRKVWVFCPETELARCANQRFYVSTSMQDLIDTWGGNAMVDAKLGHVFVEIGGGSVYAAYSGYIESTPTGQDEVLCHWSSNIYPSSAMKGSTTAKDKLLIGVTCVNKSCRLDNAACQNAIRPGALHVMGIRSPSWKTSSRAFNLGFSGKGIVSGGGALTQVKDNGTFQKRRMMEKCRNPNILNKPWGLELSLCTGVARRVLLREFFYGEVLEYLAMELAGEWRQVEEVASKIATVSDLEFSAIIKELTKDQGKVMKKATESLLLAMEPTKVGDDGHTLTLWWPERHEATPRGIKFHKDQYSGATPWTTMIKESETCAVFGLATPRCLEHHDVKTCRNPLAPAVCSDLENIMLNTYLVSVATTMMSPPLSCVQGQRLQLYKRDDTILEVIRAAVPLQNVVRVKFIPGQWPMILLKRRTKKWQEVLERQARCDQSQEVLVL